MRQSSATLLNLVDVDRMRACGAALGDALRVVTGAALVIAIEGELGAGKTTLVGGLLNSLGHVGPARSPTYTLIEPYELAGRSIQHMDLYRLADPSEVEALGVRDLLTNDAILLIEWPERGSGYVPPADLRLLLSYAADGKPGRQIEIRAESPAGVPLQRALLDAIER